MQDILFEAGIKTGVNGLEVTFTDIDESELPSSLVSEGPILINTVKHSEWSNGLKEINNTSRTMRTKNALKSMKETLGTKSTNNYLDNNIMQRSSSTSSKIKGMLQLMIHERSKKSSLSNVIPDVQLVSVKDIRKWDSAE